jgi:histidine ammonia-lyase
MQESRDLIERLVAAGEIVYGVTTGFGDLATRFIAPADADGSRRTS